MDHVEKRKVVEGIKPGDKFVITFRDKETGPDATIDESTKTALNGLNMMATAGYFGFALEVYNFALSGVIDTGQWQRLSPTIELVAGTEFNADWFCQLLLQGLEEVRMAD